MGFIYFLRYGKDEGIFKKVERCGQARFSSRITRLFFIFSTWAVEMSKRPLGVMYKRYHLMSKSQPAWLK